MPLETEINHALPEPQIDPEVSILPSRSQWQLFARNGAEQVALAQVWPLVRRLGLRAYESYASLEATVPQSGGDRISCGASADDYGAWRSSSRSLRSDQTR